MTRSPSRPLRGGVIGFGNAGRSLTRFLREHRPEAAGIVGAFDPEPQARVAMREAGLQAAETLDDLFALKLDFVIIASISSVHAPQIERAAAAGCHIFCEKPIALTLADADRAIAAAESVGVA